ncbi:S41 family peptidase [Wenzhouxiangella sp. XN24]|uniref:S41 family peptidase n=1 Tax=Wenzhouxiangella sp. XN24 TaxID=2713569 RepID=UPI0019804BB7|nr:S41 family peptidase [Wenzhouxiangella sp. XN24]
MLVTLACAALAACTSQQIENGDTERQAAGPAADSPEDLYRADALAIRPLIEQTYAYLERFPGGSVPVSAALSEQARQVTDFRSLIGYAERVLLSLADHHAILGSSLSDSWALVPSYADLWILQEDGVYVVDAVRAGSPAEQAQIIRGDVVERVGGVPIETAIEAFWAELGLPVTPERAAFAARILVAGRRDRPRLVALRTGESVRELELPSLYQVHRDERPPVSATEQAGALVIRVNDSLGSNSTIAAFDAAMSMAQPGQRIVIDLRDTPGGGNTTVARAILGWFVDAPTDYQVHSLPAEERFTGIARQWVEQVLPRPGKRHDGPVQVWVGRWTGSMGEGLAIGFDAIGAEVAGTPMAGLLGAIYDHPLEHSGLVIKLPTERLMAVDGLPRERFVPGQAAP